MDVIPNLKDLHGRAVDEFGRRVHLIGDDQWSLPTPCDEWSVCDLVGHVVNENCWTPELMAGKTMADVGDRYEGDLLGDDPVGTWDTTAKPAVAAVAGVDLDRTVHLSFGDVPAAEYAAQLFTDYLIHAWDLARAIGADERLDPELVGGCADWFSEREDMYRAAGVIADRAPTDTDADAQTQLLARFGRATN